MDDRAYETAARVENEHWWFRGRREILASVLDRHLPPRPSPRRVLEVGCGNGGNLTLLARYGSVFAIEMDDRARERASLRGIGTVARGWLPDAIPFADDSFDAIAAFDVLEHVEDDAAAVNALRDRLSTRGVLVVTVPAFQWLWSEHDSLSHHLRRYTREQLNTLLQRAGLNVLYCGCFNTLLLPLAIANIKLGGLVSRNAYRGFQTPPRLMNHALEWIFKKESFVIPRVTIPLGMSIVACALRT